MPDSDDIKSDAPASPLATATAMADWSKFSAGYFSGDDLRDYAAEMLLAHYPPNQEGNGYDRCAHCHYTNHPCDVFDLAGSVLWVLLPLPQRAKEISE